MSAKLPKKPKRSLRDEFCEIVRQAGKVATGNEEPPHGKKERWLRSAFAQLGGRPEGCPFDAERLIYLYGDHRGRPFGEDMDWVRAWAANRKNLDNPDAIAEQPREQARTFSGILSGAGGGPPTDILAEIHRCLADIDARLRAIEMALIGDNGDGHKK